jgi:hypothetical protein
MTDDGSGRGAATPVGHVSKGPYPRSGKAWEFRVVRLTSTEFSPIPLRLRLTETLPLSSLTDAKAHRALPVAPLHLMIRGYTRLPLGPTRASAAGPFLFAPVARLAQALQSANGVNRGHSVVQGDCSWISW